MSDITSGSAKDIVYGFVEQVCQEMQAVKDADTPSDNVPTSPRLSESTDPALTSTGVEIVTDNAQRGTQTKDKGKAVDRSSPTTSLLHTLTNDDMRTIKDGKVPITTANKPLTVPDNLGVIYQTGYQSPPPKCQNPLNQHHSLSP